MYIAAVALIGFTPSIPYNTSYKVSEDSFNFSLRSVKWDSGIARILGSEA
jgi:hypothetical protein